MIAADPLLLAVAQRALRIALDSAAAGAAFIPFLFWYDDLGWRVFPIMTAEDTDVADAERMAENKTRSLGESVDACAFLYDGYLTIDGVQYDAAYCRVSRRGADKGLRIAYPYRDGVPVGAARVLESVETWLP